MQVLCKQCGQYFVWPDDALVIPPMCHGCFVSGPALPAPLVEPMTRCRQLVAEAILKGGDDIDMSQAKVAHYKNVLMAKWLKHGLSLPCSMIGRILNCDTGTASRWTREHLPEPAAKPRDVHKADELKHEQGMNTQTQHEVRKYK